MTLMQHPSALTHLSDPALKRRRLPLAGDGQERVAHGEGS